MGLKPPTNEEILKQLEDKKEDLKDVAAQVNYPNDILKFIETYKLGPGEEEIHANLLYSLYRKWSTYPIKKIQFRTELSKFFTYNFNINNSTYLINYDQAKISIEIIKFLKHKRKVSSSFWQRHFENFIAKYSLEEGKFWVALPVLYYLYDKWCYSIQKNKQLSTHQFSAYMKIYFPFRVMKDRLSFGVTRTILNHITSEVIQEVQKGAEIREKREKSKGKKQKKPS